MNAPFHFEGRPDILKPPSADPWSWWMAALGGTFGPISASAPQTGFYRYRQRAADRGSPCVIWHDAESGWVCLIDGKSFRAVDHAWTFSHKRPVSQETYEAVLAGGLWPDEQGAPAPEPEAPPPAVGSVVGHNTATPEEVALDAVRQADEAFAALLKGWGGTVTNEEQDAAAKGYDERISRLRKEAEATRKAEKDEYLRGGQAIDAKWSPVKAAAVAAEDRISDAVTPYRKERKRLADVAAAEERAKRDAAKAQHSAATAVAVAAGEPPPPAPISTAPRTARPATGLREVKSVQIDDLQKLAAFLLGFAQPPDDLVEACRKNADRMLRAGAEVPGARLVISHKA